MKRTQIQVLTLSVAICFMATWGHSQVPDWTIDIGAFSGTMTVILTVSDECVPSADPNDLVAAFDIHGDIRGLGTTDLAGNIAFLVVRSNGAGEKIFFKVYDASTDGAYSVYDTSLTFIPDATQGTPDFPIDLIFDSNSTASGNAGPDQEVFDMTTTTLEGIGTGKWSIFEGVGGSFVSDTDPTTVFNGIIDEKYILVWTEDNAGGCIGESDEVVIYFVLDEPENIARTCSDGLDNDGDGFTDCLDGDCAEPVITDVNFIPPTPINCDSTLADGEMEIIHTNGDSFSIDGGMAFQKDPNFTGLEAAEYIVVIKNSIATCNSESIQKLVNTMQVNPTNPNFVDGPAIVCKNMVNLDYTADLNPAEGVITWHYNSIDVVIQANMDSTEVEVFFGTNADSTYLRADITNVCNTASDSMMIKFSSVYICEEFANCLDSAHISTPLLLSAQVPNSYKAKNIMTIDAQLPSMMYHFTAGQNLDFLPGFETALGHVMIAEIEDCNK